MSTYLGTNLLSGTNPNEVTNVNTTVASTPLRIWAGTATEFATPANHPNNAAGNRGTGTNEEVVDGSVVYIIRN